MLPSHRWGKDRMVPGGKETSERKHPFLSLLCYWNCLFSHDPSSQLPRVTSSLPSYSRENSKMLPQSHIWNCGRAIFSALAFRFGAQDLRLSTRGNWFTVRNWFTGGAGRGQSQPHRWVVPDDWTTSGYHPGHGSTLALGNVRCAGKTRSTSQYPSYRKKSF